MLPKITFRTTGDELITTGHGFGNVDAGSFVPGSSGWEVRIYNDYDGDGSEDATSVKINVRSSCGETDLIWHEQHWVEVKSYGYSTGSTGMTDDNMTTFQPVGENSPLGIGDITSTGYRTLFVRINAPTDAQENDEINLQLVATYQDPQTAITKWITGLRGNGVVASTGDPFAMSTGGTAGTIPYKAGYALIDNNEIYYGSSGTFNCSTGTAGTNAIYLAESGAFGMTTGTVTANQLQLYEATISSGVCTELTDKRVYLSGRQSGTTGAMSTTPYLGDLYLDITNGRLYAARTAGNWTVIVPGATFAALTDTPADYTDDASKLLVVTTGEDAVEFTSSTGIALDSFGTPSTGTSLNATTGRHGLLPILSGSSGEYLDGDGNFAVPKASDVEISEIGTATYDDVQDWLNNIQSGGIISGGTIAVDSSGGITISSGTGIIKSTTGDIGLTKSFDWSAGAIVSTGLTDESANYIYMDYNATGSPQILATADRTDIRLQDQFTLGRVYKSSGDLHILNTGVKIYNFSRREHERLVAVRNFERASGGEITESATTERALDSTIGNFYLGLNRVTTTAKDTSTGGSDYFTSWYYNGAWVSSTGQQQIDNTNYNDTSTGLTELLAGRYGVHWTYIHFDGDIQTVYGQGDYTLAQAEIATIPDDLPSAVSDFSTLAAKIILKKASTGFTSVVTAYKQLFPVSSPTEHNDLGGLDTADYQHLTSAEHDEITQWAGAVTLSTGGAINLVTFSTGGTVNIPSGQEYQINGSEVKLDEWATPTTGTTLNSSTGRHGLLIALDGSTGNYLRGDGSWQTPPDTGEVNTASNQGTTGVGIYYTKSTYDLQFKAIHSTGNILVTDSTGTHTINLDVISTGIKLDDFGTPDDNTDLNATTGLHGLLLKRTGSTVTYLRADGTWATPTGTTGGAAMTLLDLTDTPSDYTGDASKILVVTTGEDAVEFIPSTGILLDNLGTPEDNTDLNATTGHHGLLLKRDGNAAHWLDGAGLWTAPTASEVGALESSGAFTVNAIPQITSTGGVLKASVFAVTTGDVFDFGAHSAVFTEQAIETTTGTAAINWNSGLKALFTRSTGAAGAATFSFTAPVKSANLMLVIRGSTAGSTGTITWPTVYWQDGSTPTLTTGASAIDVVSFYYSTGLTAYLGLGSANFSTV